MRKLLSVCLPMLCLSFPVLGGHTQTGMWCDCGTPACICDEGEQGFGNGSEQDAPSQDIPAGDYGDELLFIFGAVLLTMLRYKA